MFSVFVVKNRKIELCSYKKKKCIYNQGTLSSFAKETHALFAASSRESPWRSLEPSLKQTKRKYKPIVVAIPYLKKKKNPNFYSYIDIQRCAGLLPLALAAGSCTSVSWRGTNVIFTSHLEYFLAIYAAIGPYQTFAFSSRLIISPAHICLEYWLCKLAWHVNLICTSQFIFFPLWSHISKGYN